MREMDYSDKIVGDGKSIKERSRALYDRIGWDAITRVEHILGRKWVLDTFHDDEQGLHRYQEVILGIERRWDAVMKRRDTND